MVMSYDKSYDRCGKVVHRPYSSCISCYAPGLTPNLQDQRLVSSLVSKWDQGYQYSSFVHPQANFPIQLSEPPIYPLLVCSYSQNLDWVGTEVGPVLKTMAKPIHKYTENNENSIKFSLSTQTWRVIKLSRLSYYTTEFLSKTYSPFLLSALLITDPAFEISYNFAPKLTVYPF